jgi:hypothetical protein
MELMLDRVSDDDLITYLVGLDLHPDNLDLLTRIKCVGDSSDSSESDSSGPSGSTTVPRGRKRRLLSLWESAMEAKSLVSVKFLEAPVSKGYFDGATKAAKAAKAPGPDDIFSLKWD